MGDVGESSNLIVFKSAIAPFRWSKSANTDVALRL